MQFVRSAPALRRVFLGVSLGVLGGCIQVPELDQAVPDWVATADYPALVPLGPDILVATPPAEQAEEIGDDLNARAERLKARARALDGAVIDEAARDRMDAGVGG